MDLEELEKRMKLVENKYREFIENQNNCTLCGSSLEISHKINHLMSTIKEEAHCPSCEVRTRARTYSLN